MKKDRKKKLAAITLSAGVLLSGTGINFALAEAPSQPALQTETQAAKTAVETPQLVDAASIDAVIQAMTLEEKSKFVVGVGMPGWNVPKLKVAGAVGGTIGIPRLGIPELFFADGPAGVRISPTRIADILCDRIPNCFCPGCYVGYRHD
jgi:beta-glucosidase